MDSPRVVSQVCFTLTLFSDGHLRMHEAGMWQPDESDDPQRYISWHDVEGTCDPEEMSYTLWTNMEGHI